MPDELDRYQETSLLSVEEETDWRRAPFISRARTICERDGINFEKVPAIAHTLELNFTRFVQQDGLTEKQALARLDAETEAK